VIRVLRVVFGLAVRLRSVGVGRRGRSRAARPRGAIREDQTVDYRGIAAAWRELIGHADVEILVFLAIQRPILSALERESFQAIRMGREPWMDLRSDISPRGNHAKGVRAARNQAIRSGATAREIGQGELARVAVELAAIVVEWRAMTFMELGGFLMASDPFAFAEHRRILRGPNAAGRIEAFLVASPISLSQDWFLES